MSRNTLPDTEIEWFYGLDYHEIDFRNYRKILRIFNSHGRTFIKRRISFEIPAVPIPEEYIGIFKRRGIST